MECFENNSSSNYGKFTSPEFEKIIRSAERALDLNESANLYAKAEKLLLDSAAYVPLFYKNEYFYIGEDFVDIRYNPFTKTVIFKDGKTT